MIEPGQTLQHYRIVDKIGEGGMGEVWRGEDTSLGREVAIKVLPAAWSGDAERLERFEREARLLASLNHPNVATVHGLHEADSAQGSVRFIAMEYVPGEDLATRLASGPLPLEQALEVARKIAAGLEAAHEAGVVHRDLKPANIRMTPAGDIKVLDFGLAKGALAEISGDPELSPTLTSAGTQAGVVLGTAAYMSPEQAKGQAVDRRADIWAFGVVLYEMLTGSGAFRGDSVADTMASVLKLEPDFDKLPPNTPAGVRRVLRRCLQKDPDRRLHAIADARIEIEDVDLDAAGESATSTGSATSVPAAAAPARRSAAVIVAAAAALILGAAATWILKPSADEAAPAPDARFEVMLPQGRNFASNYNRVVSISPDSRTLAYMMTEGLFLRSLDSTEQRQVPGTEEARSPAFSHDSRQIAYWDNGHIKRVSIDGGVPVVVGVLQHRPMGIHWADDDFIYVGRADLGIWRVPFSGGELEQVLDLTEGEYAHGPELLPGGEWVMFSLSRGVRAWSEGSVVAQSLKTNERRVLVQRGREARYLSNGYLTYIQDNTLFAAPFDLDELEITGATEAMETDVHTSKDDETGAASYDVSDEGVLAFAPPTGTGSRLAFLDRDHNEQPFPLGPRRLGAARLSPDDTRVAAQINDIEGTHIWVVTVDREGAQRLTTTGRNTSPVWSHDGRHVYFASVRDGVNDIWRRPADLSAPAEKVLESAGAELPNSASPDGQWLYYSRMSPGNSDIARVSLAGEPEVEVLVESPADELDCRVSADGRFICFQSNETGRWDVHVMEISSRRRWMVSSVAGYFPIWTRDGKRIFYSASGSEYRVDVSTSPEFSAGEPVHVFEWDRTHTSQTMDATHDGERLLISYDETDDGETETRPRITVVLNWFDEIEGRLQGAGSR